MDDLKETWVKYIKDIPESTKKEIDEVKEVIIEVFDNGKEKYPLWMKHYKDLKKNIK